jgi:translation initiation factor IF-1
MTIDEPTELYTEEANFFDMPAQENKTLDVNIQKMKKKAMQAMNLLKSNDKQHKYRNEQLKNALMSPYAPISRRAGRSASFNSEINNSSVPFSSMAMSRGSFQHVQKKNKFAFLNKLKIGKERKHKERMNIEDIIVEEPLDEQKQHDQIKMKQLLKSSMHMKVPHPDN